MENPTGPCQVCGDIGYKDLIMTCFNCREVREHIYCAAVLLRSVPGIWLCQECRTSTRVLQISHHVNNSTNSGKKETSMPVQNGGLRLHQPPHVPMLLAQSSTNKASLVPNDTSPIKKHRPPFLAFPSPKRKRRTLRLAEGHTEETKRQSSHP
ncbi:flavonoid protein [Arabidopsis thaliana]|uniref:Flavonoid protein n=1 Tax=Arabidopsis thaliana TaxID=3702 RepID=A0A1P8BHH9_ARATH|nr:flavonoid protein [Arabidopsis thaliana]ANM71047.1 flavonoid protein [Arabidopsis thaliana]|eukprot:NP_001332605.1 flavonoid protein [Arabidopsis thaliana]